MPKNNKHQKQSKNPIDSDNISKHSKSGEPSGTGQNYSVGTSSQVAGQDRNNSINRQTSSTDVTDHLNNNQQ